MKKVLITGASSGIGLALARSFQQQGDQVVGIARDFSKLDSSRHQVGAFIETVCDLADLDALRQALDENAALNADFDVIVLNAGYGRFGGLEQFSYQQIQDLINTNLVSNLFLMKHFLPKLKMQGGKDVVVIGSESALQGARQGAVYCASKFALRGFAQSLRADCANTDVRVMMVNPGPVDTDFFEELNFTPASGDQFVIDPQSIVNAVQGLLKQPRQVVTEEINIQPIKRSFAKKRTRGF